MIQDLHSHTYYSFDSVDSPDDVINAAIAGGVELLGFSDHNYGIAQQRSTTVFPDEERRLNDYQMSVNRYLDHMRLLSAHYRDQIKILCGIEISTRNQPHLLLPDSIDVSRFDYCLIEYIDNENTTVSDVFDFARRCNCAQVGIAHTDLFSYINRTGTDADGFFRKMAEHNMFWELNVNYDSIHHYRQHSYVKEFLESPAQQKIVRDSGVKISVGFDSHRVCDYRADKIRDCCQKLEQLQIKLAFAENE